MEATLGTRLGHDRRELEGVEEHADLQPRRRGEVANQLAGDLGDLAVAAAGVLFGLPEFEAPRQGNAAEQNPPGDDHMAADDAGIGATDS